MKSRICTDCHGRGFHEVEKPSIANPKMTYATTSQCKFCRGNGRLYVCEVCGNSAQQTFLLPTARFKMVSRCYECHIIERDRQEQKLIERWECRD
jgi:RecJ-like exonuclease